SRESMQEFQSWQDKMYAISGDPAKIVPASVAISTTPLPKDGLDKIGSSNDLLKDFVKWYEFGKDARAAVALTVSGIGANQRAMPEQREKFSRFRLWYAATARLGEPARTAASAQLALSDIGSQRIDGLTVDQLSAASHGLLDERQLGQLLGWLKSVKAAA